MLPKKAIEEFKQIYKKEEGKDLNDKEAVVLANNLMTVFIGTVKKSRSKFEHSSVSHIDKKS